MNVIRSDGTRAIVIIRMSAEMCLLWRKETEEKKLPYWFQCFMKREFSF